MHQMQIDVEQRWCPCAIRNYMVVPDLFDDVLGFVCLKTHIASATASPTSEVVAGLPEGFKSAVTRPELSTVSTARFTAAASCFSPKLYSSSAATEPIAP